MIAPTRARGDAAAAVALGILALALAPAGVIVVGFRAAAAEPVPGWAWLLGAGGLAAAAWLLLGARAHLPGGAPARRTGARLAWAALALSAVGPVFWLLVQLAPSADQLSGETANPLLGPVGFAVAFLVGMISFFTPCILPLLPGYLTFVSGLSGEELAGGEHRTRILTGTALFTLGFATVFTVLGITASAVGGFFVEHQLGFNRIAGAIVILMGVAFLLPQAVGFLERERRPFMRHVRPGIGGAYPLGLAFGLGWTPCIGPGLGAMLGLGASTGSVGRGGLLLFFFSLGFGVWFVLAGLAVRRALGASGWLRSHARALQAIGGTFMLAIGVLLVTDRWDALLGPLRTFVNKFTPPV